MITKEEKEANQFAMELLMPEDFVRKEIRELTDFDIIDDNQIMLLAEKFEVSISVMTLRLAQLQIIRT